MVKGESVKVLGLVKSSSTQLFGKVVFSPTLFELSFVVI